MYTINFTLNWDKRHYEPRAKLAPFVEKSSRYRVGKCQMVDFPFIPFVGLHLGDWQMITICQVYYRGIIKKITGPQAVFDVDCVRLSDPDYTFGFNNVQELWPTVEAAEQEIIQRTQMNWIFTDDLPEANKIKSD